MWTANGRRGGSGLPSAPWGLLHLRHRCCCCLGALPQPAPAAPTPHLACLPKPAPPLPPPPLDPRAGATRARPALAPPQLTPCVARATHRNCPTCPRRRLMGRAPRTVRRAATSLTSTFRRPRPRSECGDMSTLRLLRKLLRSGQLGGLNSDDLGACRLHGPTNDQLALTATAVVLSHYPTVVMCMRASGRHRMNGYGGTCAQGWVFGHA